MCGVFGGLATGSGERDAECVIGLRLDPFATDQAEAAAHADWRSGLLARERPEALVAHVVLYH
jgi:hypothetical protein